MEREAWHNGNLVYPTSDREAWCNGDLVFPTETDSAPAFVPKIIWFMALALMFAFSGCTTPRAYERGGAIYCSPGVVAERVVDGEKRSWKIDTTQHNWWSRVQDISGRTLDRLAGMVERTTATVGE